MARHNIPSPRGTGVRLKGFRWCRGFRKSNLKFSSFLLSSKQVYLNYSKLRCGTSTHLCIPSRINFSERGGLNFRWKKGELDSQKFFQEINTPKRLLMNVTHKNCFVISKLTNRFVCDNHAYRPHVQLLPCLLCFPFKMVQMRSNGSKEYSAVLKRKILFYIVNLW